MVLRHPSLGYYQPFLISTQDTYFRAEEDPFPTTTSKKSSAKNLAVMCLAHSKATGREMNSHCNYKWVNIPLYCKRKDFRQGCNKRLRGGGMYNWLHSNMETNPSKKDYRKKHLPSNSSHKSLAQIQGEVWNNLNIPS